MSWTARCVGCKAALSYVEFTDNKDVYFFCNNTSCRQSTVTVSKLVEALEEAVKFMPVLYQEANCADIHCEKYEYVLARALVTLALAKGEEQ